MTDNGIRGGLRSGMGIELLIIEKSGSAKRLTFYSSSGVRCSTMNNSVGIPNDADVPKQAG